MSSLTYYPYVASPKFMRFNGGHCNPESLRETLAVTTLNGSIKPSVIVSWKNSVRQLHRI